MPLYVYSCVRKSHLFEIYMPMSKGGKALRCPKCKGESHVVYTPFNVGGGMISEATRKLLSVPLGRKNMESVRTAGDVDRVLNKIERTYGHMAKGLGRNTSNYPTITKGHED